MEEFIKHFADQLLEPESVELKSCTIFRELEDWDSLTAMAVTTMIEDEYNVIIFPATFKNLHTIEDLYKHIKSKDGAAV